MAAAYLRLALSFSCILKSISIALRSELALADEMFLLHYCVELMRLDVLSSYDIECSNELLSII